MGNPLFGVDISGLIKQHVGSGVLDATLTKSTPGTRTAGDLGAGTNPTTTNYPCKGFIDKQKRKHVEGGLEDDGTVTIVLIGDTIDNGNQAAEPGDSVTIEGSTYQIADDATVDRDPAAATYTFTARPV